jgi:hypothetical protein
MFGLTGWHVLIILGVLVLGAAVIIGIALTIIVVARRASPAGPIAPTSPLPPTAAASVVNDPVEQIRKLAELRDQGLLSEEEFQAKRTELLGRI